MKALHQFGRFAVVGAFNTLLDLGVLNLLMFAFSVATGLSFSLFKAISFLISASSSYFCNKFWTFKNNNPVSLKEYTRFLTFALGGLVINVGIASALVNLVSPPFAISPQLWANISALVAVGASLIWNFFNYRFIVFRS